MTAEQQTPESASAPFPPTGCRNLDLADTAEEIRAFIARVAENTDPTGAVIRERLIRRARLKLARLAADPNEDGLPTLNPRGAAATGGRPGYEWIEYDPGDHAAAVARFARRYPVGTRFVFVHRDAGLEDVYALTPGADELTYASKEVGAVLRRRISDGTKRSGVNLGYDALNLDAVTRDLSRAVWGGPEAYTHQSIR